MTQVASAPGACVSCSSPVTGRFCSACGEEVFDPHTLTVKHFFLDTVADELIHVDAKVWRTLRALLFRPGFLSAEYAIGRRRMYVNPMRLLVIAILIYALATRAGGVIVTLQIGTVSLSIAPTRVRESATIEKTIEQLDRFHVLAPLVAATAKTVDLHAPDVHGAFHRRLEAVSEPLSFSNVALLAVALFALFHRRRALLVEHAVFSMHFVAFVLLSSLLLLPGVSLVRAAPVVAGNIFLAVSLWQFAYIATALRRFYFAGLATWRGRAAAIAAGMAIYILNSAFLTAVQAIGAAYALWSL
ncbi:MAG TPA: DUF3667 domain-containing protein [Vicinamibacterales bacterium]|nr:DUF3667 domain-containing protein [Vicinamibacterales bacterium]